MIAITKERLEQSSQNLVHSHLILEEMPIGLIVANHQFYIERVNARIAQMLGYTSKNLLGKHLTLLLANDAEQQQKWYLANILAKATGSSVEVSVRLAHSGTLPMQLSVSKVRMSDGTRYLITLQDISTRHKAERLKQEFVAMIGHEIKTPLASIMGNLALFSAEAFGKLSAKGKHIVSASERQAQRLLNLINELLLLEKLESGEFSVRMSSTSLSDVLTDAREAVRSLASSRSITVFIESTTAVAYADAERLLQVLINLLANAIRFSPNHGTVKISIKETSTWLELRVSDEGRGVPLAYRSVIFEKFKQVKISDERVLGGTGLGLPICKMIVEKHGGTIGVDSGTDKGSTFWFRIPKAPLPHHSPLTDPVCATSRT